MSSRRRAYTWSGRDPCGASIGACSRPSSLERALPLAAGGLVGERPGSALGADSVDFRLVLIPAAIYATPGDGDLLFTTQRRVRARRPLDGPAHRPVHSPRRR